MDEERLFTLLERIAVALEKEDPQVTLAKIREEQRKDRDARRDAAMARRDELRAARQQTS